METEPEPRPEPEKPLDRRGILRFGGGAALAGATAALLRPSVAGAATAAGTGPMRFGTSNAALTRSTGLSSTNGKYSLHVTNAGLGDAIVGDVTKSTGHSSGVVGTSIGGAGVAGSTRGDGPGVRAYVFPGARGSALQARTDESDNSAPTVVASQGGTGHGVYAHIENVKNASRAVYARTMGTGQAVLALVTNAQSSAAAVRAATKGAGPGIDAASSRGVGAVFAGKTAQVQLVPSSAASHPAKGSSGQLFVDRANRLWFCREGTNWQRLA